MKKKFYLILLTVFMAFALAACSGETDGDDDRDDKRVERSDKDNDDEDDEDDKKDNDKDDKKDNDEDDKKDNDEDDKKDNDEDDKKDVPTIGSGTEASEICGTWALEYDGSEQMSTQLGTDVTFTFTILMDFNADSTMRMYVDPDTLKEEVNNSLVPVMTEMVYEQAAAQGLGDDRQAVDDAFNSAYGMGVKEFCEASLAESLDGLADSFNTTASYKVDGDKLWLADDDGTLSDYVLFSISGDTLTLDDPSGAEEVEGLKLPLVLKRQ